jgi:serine/threonine protein kinase
MPSPAIFDIPKLAERIREISKTYPEKQGNNPVDGTPEDPWFQPLKEPLRSVLRMSINLDKKYWKSAGIRVEGPDEFQKCMDKLKKHAKLSGEGAFGKVYSVPNDVCFKNVPRGVKRLGVKIETIGGADGFKAIFGGNVTPERLRDVTKIAKIAGTLGIGPKMYDAFVSVDQHNTVQVVKIFEFVDGKTWADTKWKNPKAREDAQHRLEDLIHKMNGAGIIHHDLHTKNVMIGKNGKLYIIDFDLAKFSKNEESGAIGRFEDPPRFMFEESAKGVSSDNGIRYIYNKLVEEGDIILPAFETPVIKQNTNKTRKRRNN